MKAIKQKKSIGVVRRWGAEALNILSFLSVAVFMVYIYMAKNMSPTAEHIYRFYIYGVELSLAWWSFCNAFFFPAATREAAMFWIRLSSFGWIGVAFFTLMGVCYITDRKHYINTPWKRICLAAPAITMLLLNLCGETTSVAYNFTQSVFGLGWTYVNQVTNFKYWLLVAYILLYFGVAIGFLGAYAKKADKGATRSLSAGLVVLDGILVIMCAFTDLILPFFPLEIPPIANIISVFFGIVFVRKLQRFDFNSIEKAFPSSMIIETSFDPLCIVDTNGVIRFCNRAMARLFECKEVDLKGYHIIESIVKDKKYEDFLQKLMRHEKILSSEVYITTFQGNVAAITLNLTWLFEGGDVPRGGILFLHDIPEQVNARKQMQELAYHDQLTGLSNRLNFNATIETYIEEYMDKSREFAVISLDVNRFKQFNDTYGHHMGDLVLGCVASALRSSVSPEDQVFRVGGDEFMVLVQVENQRVLDGIVRRISHNLCREEIIDGKMLQLSISIGAVLYSEQCDLEKILSLADERMYQNKRVWAADNKLGGVDEK